MKLNKKNLTLKKFYFILTAIIVVLFLLSIVLMVLLFHSRPKVFDVTFASRLQPFSFRQITVTFSREMDRKSVEENFSLSPFLVGKFSWAGKKLIFTPEQGLQYNTDYRLIINQKAKDKDGVFLAENFEKKFSTPKLRFGYIGSEGNEAGRLVLRELKSDQRVFISDENMKVEHFQFCPDRNCVYFLAYRDMIYQNKMNELFRFDFNNKKLFQITNDRNFINTSFQLSADGEKILLSRIAFFSNGEYLSRPQLWFSDTSNYHFQIFPNAEVSALNYLLSPDGKYLLYRNRKDNFELTSLSQQNNTAPIFIGGFHAAYAFHPFKPQVAFVQYEEGDLFSIFNQLIIYFGDGAKETVPYPKGLVRDSVFTPDGKNLISIFSGESDIFDDKVSFYPLRIFHLYSYDFHNGSLKKLTDDFDYSEEGQVVSPDGRYLLFERYETFSEDLIIDPDFRDVAAGLGDVTSGGEIWLMDLKNLEMFSLGIRGSKLAFVP